MTVVPFVLYMSSCVLCVLRCLDFGSCVCVWFECVSFVGSP